MNIPDHPIIQNMETTGTPDGKSEKVPHCPACGAECETVYRDGFGNYIGCNVCIETKDAWEVDKCFPESEDK